MHIQRRSDNNAQCSYINLNILLSVLDAESAEKIRLDVMSGQRPPLNAVTGPEPEVKFIKDCINDCWHQSQDSRPTFAGIYNYFSYSFVINTQIDVIL